MIQAMLYWVRSTLRRQRAPWYDTILFYAESQEHLHGSGLAATPGVRVDYRGGGQGAVEEARSGLWKAWKSGGMLSPTAYVVNSAGSGFVGVGYFGHAALHRHAD